MNFYNDIDPKACAWIRELISAGEIPSGTVDERSITEIDPDELSRFTQCHFFAGIAGWAYALRLAGWPADRPVWTASLPCQPFSAAGKQEGGGDARNLWTPFFAIVQRCGPQRLFGEQVEAAIGFGWIDRVFADLGAEGYACGAAVLGAHSVGAPHRRQRLYWMANADGGRCEQRHAGERPVSIASTNSADGSLADTSSSARPEQWEEPRQGSRRRTATTNASECPGPRGIIDPEGEARDEARLRMSGAGCAAGRMGDTPCAGREGPQSELLQSGQTEGRLPAGSSDPSRLAHTALPKGERLTVQHEQLPRPSTFWDRFDSIPCRDGKGRRIESGTFPLANGISGRVGLLRGYGNAIVPQVAATFIQACEEALTDSQ